MNCNSNLGIIEMNLDNLLLVTRPSFRSPPPSSHLCSRGINIQEEDKDDSGGELSCKDGQ